MQVIDDALSLFDQNHDGTVDYSEFIAGLFPNLSKGFKMDY